MTVAGGKAKGGKGLAKEGTYADFEKALDLADPALWAFRTLLFQHLAEPVLKSVRLSQATAAFVEEAGAPIAKHPDHRGGSAG